MGVGLSNSVLTFAMSKYCISFVVLSYVADRRLDC
nr:MAG TPA: hypothetical protein [Caudoviricetes sp.]